LRNPKSAGKPTIFAALLMLLSAANALNVLNSHVGRNFMTAIADRHIRRSLKQKP
jgi:vitamin B12/bleomycin/antimicrobial peptide transport system ATP-binding/permease protein